jgi:hypothetical protein
MLCGRQSKTKPGENTERLDRARDDPQLAKPMFTQETRNKDQREKLETR